MGDRRIGPEHGWSQIVPGSAGWWEVAYEEVIDNDFPSLCLYLDGFGGIFTRTKAGDMKPVHGAFDGAWWRRWRGAPIANEVSR